MLSPLTSLQAFLEGVALIASPCILPVLPLILSSSISSASEKNTLRAYGVLAGFVITFSAFTLLSRQLLQYFGVQPQWLQVFAEVMLIVMGLILCSERLSDAFSRLMQPLAQWGQNLSSTLNRSNPSAQQDNFWTGFLLGGCIGLIWTPCAGPILASVIVQTALQQNNEQSIVSVLAFSLGAGFPMLLIARGSQWVLSWLTWAKENSLMIRKLTGAVILATVLFTLQQGVITLPGSNTTVTPSTADAATLTGGLSSSYKSPEVDSSGSWINSKPLSISQLKGKVVLIDFWTYSCINCLRTLPYIKQWYERYHAQGLEIIGVHTPEFLFEQDINNVRAAVNKQGIKYPVTLDNQYRTWRNFSNQYWPAHYLINKEGQVVYTHFGEGAYDVTENNIRALLGLKVSSKKENTDNTRTAFGEAGIGQTPETYLGYEKGSGFSSPESLQRDKTQVFSYPSFLPVHAWALSGKWELQSERSIARQGKAAFRLNFYGKSAHMVMGTGTHKPIQVSIKVNGKPAQTLTVQDHKLYTLTTLPKVGNAQVDLETNSPGLAIYALTFGS